MDGSHSVNCVGSNNGQVCHVDSLLTTFLHQGHAPHAIHVARPTLVDFLSSNMASQFQHNVSFVTDNVRSTIEGDVFTAIVILSTGLGSLSHDAPGQARRIPRPFLAQGSGGKETHRKKKTERTGRKRGSPSSGHLWNPPPLARVRYATTPSPASPPREEVWE